MVEDGEGDRSFTNATDTDESDGIEILDEADDPLDQFVTTETSLWWWGRRLSKCARFKRKSPECL